MERTIGFDDEGFDDEETFFFLAGVLRAACVVDELGRGEVARESSAESVRSTILIRIDRAREERREAPERAALERRAKMRKGRGRRRTDLLPSQNCSP